MSKLIDIAHSRKKVDTKMFFMNILFVGITIYIIFAIYLIIKTPTDTVIVEDGTLTSEESSTGYIIRDEIVVKGNNYKNGLYQIVLEGKRAAKNQTIFRYYNKKEEELQNKIDEINLKIQKALEKENTYFPSDIKSLEEQIDLKIQNINTLKSIQDLKEYKKQISEIILKKATIAGENSKSGTYIKKLINQREDYEEQLLEGSEYVSAPESGVISYRVDGLEEVLTPENIENITEEQLESLDIKTGKIISSSEECAKIINNFECYIIAILDSDSAKEAEEGQKILITLSGGKEIDATIKSKNEQEDGKIIVVFELKTLTEELISYRKISFNITWWSVSGIKIPNDAIVEDENGLKYVIKKSINGNKKCLIKVQKTNNRYSIIETYNLNELSELGINAEDYNELNVYDSIMLYPE